MLMELLTNQVPLFVGSEIDGYTSESKQVSAGKARVNQFLYDTLGPANRTDPSLYTALTGLSNRGGDSLDDKGVDPSKLSQLEGRNASEKQVIQELLSLYGALRV